MDVFNRSALQQLLDFNQCPCLSIFMETHPSGQESEQDAIRLHNLLRGAEEALSANWMRSSDARTFVASAEQLPRDQEFWSHRSQGLALFVANHFLQSFRVDLPFTESATIAERFRIRPILPLLEKNLDFYLLVLSENRVALYSVDRQGIRGVDVPELPSSLKECLNYTGIERGQQVHTAMRGVAGKEGAVFHGQGGEEDDRLNELGTYCIAVDRAVTRYLGQTQRRLVLACVDDLAAIYRSKNTFRQLSEEFLGGNFDRAAEHELHQRALALAEPWNQLESRRVAERYGNGLSRGGSIDDPRQIVLAAKQGRVESLVYDPKAHLLGISDMENGKVAITGKDDDDDLVDLAALETIRHGGSVYSMLNLEIATNEPLAAILRY